jgi:hypothetical protein
MMLLLERCAHRRRIGVATRITPMRGLRRMNIMSMCFMLVIGVAAVVGLVTRTPLCSFFSFFLHLLLLRVVVLLTIHDHILLGLLRRMLLVLLLLLLLLMVVVPLLSHILCCC